MSYEDELRSILTFSAGPAVADPDTQPTPVVDRTKAAETVSVEPTEDTTELLPVSIEAEESTESDDYVPTVEKKPWVNKRAFGLVGALAISVAAGVLVAKTTTSDHVIAGPPKPVTSLGALPTSSTGPSVAPSPDVQDYSIDYFSIGPNVKGYRPLGSYAAKPTQLIAVIRDHEYLVTTAQTQVEMFSSAKKAGEAVVNNGTAHNSVADNEAYKKLVTINQADIQGSARIAKGTKTPTIKPLSELQALLDTHPNYKPSTVCTQLPLLDGCKNAKSWALTKAEKARIIYGAQALALLAVQKTCAVVEMDSVKKHEAAAYAAQAQAQNIDPKLIEIVYEHASAVPYFIKSPLATIAKKGGETSTKKLAQLFKNPAITTTCVAAPVIPAKG